MEIMKKRTDLQGCNLFKEAQFQHMRAIQHQNDFWKQRAKEFWLKDGDQNTAFFHKSVRRRQTKNRILRLKNDHDVWAERGNDLNSLILNYFHNLYSVDSGDTHSILDNLEAKVDNIQNSILLRKFSNEEIREALYEMKPDKSPGPDGLPRGFFNSIGTL